ncbi:FAD-binding protein [Bacillus timonensis]|uniref:FAD-binding protein n=1 Tax=Bacillus timonensis TaxID=1033734 RepID=A0A4S3PMM3_9BACI|nr:FAD-dependent monooxygenase [Bacillus timonensis]THE10780.1 FAD-binding protein [Bacillus timonensis]
MNLQTDVCIVGGGPAGALLGYLLAEKGISTIVVERTSGNEREFRGEHINAETEAILKEHQLFDKIEALGLLKMKKVEYLYGSNIVKSITPTDEDHIGIHIPQPHFLTAVSKEAAQFPNYQLLLNTSVNELVQDEKGNYTGVKAKQNGQEINISSSIVVGTDGRYSTVRKLAGIVASEETHGYDVLWAKIPAPAGWVPSTKMVLVNGHQLALFTQTGGLIQIGWNIEEGTFNTLRKQPLEPFLEPLLISFPELEPIVREHIQSWKNFVCLKVFSSKADTWVKDGLVILGDAAHTMTPTAAIGINCAIKDAHVLAPILEQALIDRDFSESRLKEFEVARRTEIEQQQEMQFEKEESFQTNFLEVVGH